MKKLLFDLFPLILFFAAYRYADIYAATAVAMAAGVAQIAWLRITGRPIEPMHWINLGVIVVFGSATLLLHDDTFIKWKPTVLYWLFGGALLGARLFAGRNLLRQMLRGDIPLADTAWDRLNTSWTAFFLAAGALNLYVAFSGHFTEAQWVNFKVFGLMGLLLAFVVLQSIWLSRHIQPEDGQRPAAGPGDQAGGQP